MPYKLKDRNRQIPNGLRFLQPETNWQPPRFASFTVIVNGLINHRKTHPGLVQSKGWSLDPAVVAEEVDAFNALICVRHNWMDYVMSGEGEAPPPKPQALLAQEKDRIAAAAGRAKKIWSGVTTLNSWIDSGTPPVPKELAEARAKVCAACPQNGKGDFSAWFTVPASDAIRIQLERAKGMKLSTSFDEKINVCNVCLCPLKLKVHTPIAYMKEHTSQQVRDELARVPGCWVIRELAA